MSLETDFEVYKQALIKADGAFSTGASYGNVLNKRVSNNQAQREEIIAKMHLTIAINKFLDLGFSMFRIWNGFQEICSKEFQKQRSWSSSWRPNGFGRDNDPAKEIFERELAIAEGLCPPMPGMPPGFAEHVHAWAKENPVSKSELAYLKSNKIGDEGRSYWCAFRAGARLHQLVVN